jgi:hypothetical protein
MWLGWGVWVGLRTGDSRFVRFAQNDSQKNKNKNKGKCKCKCKSNGKGRSKGNA